MKHECVEARTIMTLLLKMEKPLQNKSCILQTDGQTWLEISIYHWGTQYTYCRFIVVSLHSSQKKIRFLSYQQFQTQFAEVAPLTWAVQRKYLIKPQGILIIYSPKPDTTNQMSNKMTTTKMKPLIKSDDSMFPTTNAYGCYQSNASQPVRLQCPIVSHS